ncbi:uncharacterized protein VTP21DRAFT_3268 [Calcarisporiella thermophila]|uniref:uncharacterized protein n=1 Tax=Calcarisporiella thermophila TaxID=911321 RepID=UPI0037435940
MEAGTARHRAPRTLSAQFPLFPTLSQFRRPEASRRHSTPFHPPKDADPLPTPLADNRATGVAAPIGLCCSRSSSRSSADSSRSGGGPCRGYPCACLSPNSYVSFPNPDSFDPLKLISKNGEEKKMEDGEMEMEGYEGMVVNGVKLSC